MNEQFDLAIIGAGPGGYSTALRAAELGMSVALIERDATVGGTCLNRGCIPSKALITATHTIDTVHRAAELGVLSNMQKAGFDFPQEPVWIDPKTKDAIWRGTSMNGIYLIGEGEYGRVMKAMDRQEHEIKGVTAGSTIPVYRIAVGHGPKQVPLDKLRSTVTKAKSYEPTNHKNALVAKIHPRRRFLLTRAETTTLNERLHTLQSKKGYSIPKGMDPNRPQKISRRAMRGR